jgi:RNA polymerase sigma factor (sigma-70 family)
MYLTDEEILQNFRIKGREEYAFSHLVRKYQEKIYHTIRRMVINHEDSNDITQEVFVKIWKGLGEFREHSKLFTWMYRIAINESMNFLNRKKRKAWISLTKVEKKLEQKLESTQQYDGDEIHQKLQKAILRLPEKQRLVFNMRYYEELPYETMSEILNTSVGALKASYHFAAGKIEKYLFYD